MDLPLTAALAAGAALLVLGCAYFALARARAVVRDVFRALGLIRDEARQVDRRLQEAARELEIVKERVSDIRAAMGLTQSAVWADALPEFLTPFDWNGAIAEASLRRPEPILAHAFVRRRATGSQPVDLRCADGSVYVVKGPRLDDPDQSCRIFAEYVVGRLARLIGAPVSDVALISIPPSLIAAHCDPQHGMGHLLPGEAHGSRFGDGLGEHSHEIKHIAANRERLRLARDSARVDPVVRSPIPLRKPAAAPRQFDRPRQPFQQRPEVAALAFRRPAPVGAGACGRRHHRGLRAHP